MVGLFTFGSLEAKRAQKAKKLQKNSFTNKT
jgi:hypothetical protein